MMKIGPVAENRSDRDCIMKIGPVFRNRSDLVLDIFSLHPYDLVREAVINHLEVLVIVELG